MAGSNRRAACVILVASAVALVLMALPVASWATGPSLSLDLGTDAPKHTAVVIQILMLLTVLSLAIMAGWLVRAGLPLPRSRRSLRSLR